MQGVFILVQSFSRAILGIFLMGVFLNPDGMRMFVLDYPRSSVFCLCMSVTFCTVYADYIRTAMAGYSRLTLEATILIGEQGDK